MTKLMIVGEALSKDDVSEGRPFAGAAGKLLTQMLRQVGIACEECYLTNVFNLRPLPTADIKNFCGPKAEAIPGRPAFASGKYVRREYADELARLEAEVARVRPNLVLALGQAASWFFLGQSSIDKVRGTCDWSTVGRGVKVLPATHPSAIFRQWGLRPVALADFAKARREQEFPELRRPQRTLWINPTLSDLPRYFDEHIAPAKRIALDIETIDRIITCIGFAPSASSAIVVPFFDPSAPGKNYWPSFDAEMVAWQWVKSVCALDKEFILQNGLYDIRFLWETMGITVPGAAHDTMLMHHALQPELRKGLGFLASVYTDEASWKFMRTKGTLKKEDE